MHHDAERSVRLGSFCAVHSQRDRIHVWRGRRLVVGNRRVEIRARGVRKPLGRKPLLVRERHDEVDAHAETLLFRLRDRAQSQCIRDEAEVARQLRAVGSHDH
eukprot:2579191-Rhodomonas_salina.4